MNNSQIGILILSTNAKSYQVFINAIRKSWYINAIDSGFKVFFYSGGHAVDGIYNTDEIWVTEDDSIPNCYRKFIAAKNVLTRNFPEVELIYRTNLSSYIDIDNFSKYIDKASFTKKSFHGVRGKANKYSEIHHRNKLLHLILKYFRIGATINFFSGAGFFIGIELCDSLSYTDSIKYLIDDVEIGSQIKDYTKHEINYERIYITDTYTKMNIYSYQELVEQHLLFHYKFKTNDRGHDAFLLQQFSDFEFRKAFLTL